jgi:hypothetical protein
MLVSHNGNSSVQVSVSACADIDADAGGRGGTGAPHPQPHLATQYEGRVASLARAHWETVMWMCRGWWTCTRHCQSLAHCCQADPCRWYMVGWNDCKTGDDHARQRL